MKNNNFNLNGGEVTLDLPALKKVLATGTANLTHKLQDELRQISNDLSNAHSAEYKGDSHESYREMSHANTARESLARTAQDLADSIHALFHISEACRRETIKVATTGKGGDPSV